MIPRLPGGLIEDGVRHRDVTLHAIDGHVQLLATEVASDGTPATAVTALLAAAVRDIGALPSTPARMASLSVADRELLLRTLATVGGNDTVWLTACCGGCDALFDLRIRQSDLPVIEASPRFPAVEVATSIDQHRVHVPTGADQEAVESLPPADRPAALLARLVEDADVKVFGPQDVRAIDAALEELAPEVGRWVRAVCPECSSPNRIEVPPALTVARLGESVLEEIHTLASTYHWSEAEIVALPDGRRQRYLDLIGEVRASEPARVGS
jgi:hypothetical protein